MDEFTAEPQEKSLVQVLAEAKSRGAVEIRHGSDLYVVTHKRTRMTEKTRAYLLKGGPDDGDD